MGPFEPYVRLGLPTGGQEVDPKVVQKWVKKVVKKGSKIGVQNGVKIANVFWPFFETPKSGQKGLTILDHLFGLNR